MYSVVRLLSNFVLKGLKSKKSGITSLRDRKGKKLRRSSQRDWKKNQGPELMRAKAADFQGGSCWYQILWEGK